MEIINAIADLISSVGFPIATCIYLFYNNARQTEAWNALNNTLTKIDMRLEALENKDN